MSIPEMTPIPGDDAKHPITLMVTKRFVKGAMSLQTMGPLKRKHP